MNGFTLIYLVCGPLVNAVSTSLTCGGYTGQPCHFTTLTSNAAISPGVYSFNKSYADYIRTKPTATAFSSRCPLIHGGVWYDNDYCSSITETPVNGTIVQTWDSSTTSSPKYWNSSSSSMGQGSQIIPAISGPACSRTVQSDSMTTTTSPSHSGPKPHITATVVTSSGTSTSVQGTTASVYDTTSISTVKSTKSSTGGSPGVTALADVAVAGLVAVLIL